MVCIWHGPPHRKSPATAEAFFELFTQVVAPPLKYLVPHRAADAGLGGGPDVRPVGPDVRLRPRADSGHPRHRPGGPGPSPGTGALLGVEGSPSNAPPRGAPLPSTFMRLNRTRPDHFLVMVPRGRRMTD